MMLKISNWLICIHIFIFGIITKPTHLFLYTNSSIFAGMKLSVSMDHTFSPDSETPHV